MSLSDNWLSGEPPVNELMADPILHMVLRRDRLRARDVWSTLRDVQEKLHPDHRRQSEFEMRERYSRDLREAVGPFGAGKDGPG